MRGEFGRMAENKRVESSHVERERQSASMLRVEMDGSTKLFCESPHESQAQGRCTLEVKPFRQSWSEIIVCDLNPSFPEVLNRDVDFGCAIGFESMFGRVGEQFIEHHAHGQSVLAFGSKFITRQDELQRIVVGGVDRRNQRSEF